MATTRSSALVKPRKVSGLGIVLPCGRPLAPTRMIRYRHGTRTPVPRPRRAPDHPAGAHPADHRAADRRRAQHLLRTRGARPHARAPHLRAARERRGLRPRLPHHGGGDGGARAPLRRRAHHPQARRGLDRTGGRRQHVRGPHRAGRPAARRGARLLRPRAGLLDGLAKGYSVAEIVWGTREGLWWPVEYKWRDPRLFVHDIRTKSEIRLATDGLIEGLPLERGRFITHVPKLKTGSRSGAAWRGRPPSAS